MQHQHHPVHFDFGPRSPVSLIGSILEMFHVLQHLVNILADLGLVFAIQTQPDAMTLNLQLQTLRIFKQKFIAGHDLEVQ
jgi:hypothetical protein